MHPIQMRDSSIVASLTEISQKSQLQLIMTCWTLNGFLTHRQQIASGLISTEDRKKVEFYHFDSVL